MELSRRQLGVALIALCVAAATGAVASRGRARPAAAIVAHAYPIPSPEQRIQVEVLNGTARPSLARSATRLLRREGLDVVFFGNADDARPDSTQVIARRGDRSSAERVARALGQGVVSVRADTLRRVDVTVLLGADFRPPADAHP
ncbi:MAG TPA: LytR C-terminal domain-containing protein [Gemmatimonadales bacterium]